MAFGHIFAKITPQLVFLTADDGEVSQRGVLNCDFICIFNVEFTKKYTTHVQSLLHRRVGKMSVFV